MTSRPHIRAGVNGAAAAAPAGDGLPPLESLVTWVHRPCAIARCHISDIYSMRALVLASQQNLSYASRDVFLLDRFPCKMVHIVAWVAGVDHKEASMTITLDDGSDHVLPVLVRLTLYKPPKSFNTSKATGTGTNQSIGTGRTSFASVKDRLAKQRQAASAEAEKAKPAGKVYERKDVLVGDTVKVVGKIDEWLRKKANGETEWVRQVVVDEGAGGSIVVVDPDMQYLHTAQVHDLHKFTYNKPFSIPEFVPKSQPPTPTKSLPSLRYDHSTRDCGGDGSVSGYGRIYGDSIGSSEAPSELTIAAEGDEPELRDPDRLRSSQLTDRTFRHYMLDHMTQETIRSLRDIAAQGPEATRLALEMYFPEYKSSNKEKGKGKAANTTMWNGGVFAPSTRHNSLPPFDDQNTPRSTRFASRKSIVPQCNNTLSSDIRLEAFTVASIISDDRLSRLARLVVDNELRKEEKRHRRRIRDGQATKKDLSIENERKINGIGVGKDYLDSITEKEKLIKMERLVGWVIRDVAQEGSLIQVRNPNSNKEYGYGYGYLPIPPQLLYPLLVPHLETERFLRKATIRRKGDPKTGNGMTVDELCVKLRCWGEDGRWERIGDWNVEAALEWAGERGLTRREGRGWWVDDES